MAGGITQLYPDSGTSNALYLQGVPISGAAVTPSDGQILKYNAAINEWVPGTGGGGGGAVSSVNSQLPDGAGNVTLTAANVGAASKGFSIAMAAALGL
jgi:hypothetical protein